MISVVDYDPAWVAQYEAARDELLSLLGVSSAAVEHVGSTAVPGLKAKPIIDIVVGLPPDELEDERLDGLLEPVGYTKSNVQTLSTARRLLFRRRRSDAAVNLHLVDLDGSLWWRLIILRDFFRANPSVANG